MNKDRRGLECPLELAIVAVAIFFMVVVTMVEAVRMLLST